MAPELLDGEGVSRASDIYALGVLFYRLVAGHYPHEAKDFEELREKVGETPRLDRASLKGSPRAFRSLLRRMLAQDPAQRPAALQLRKEIDWLITQPQRRVKRFALGTIATLLAGVAIASSLGYWFSSRAEHQMELARAETQAVNGFLTNMLASASPAREGKDVRVTEVLSQAEASLNFGEELPPEVRNDVKLTLASTYLGLRMLDEAERILNEILVDSERSLSPATEWKARDLLALVYSDQRDWGEAVEMAHQSLRLAETIERDSDMLLDSEITLARAHLQHADRAQAVVRLEQAIAKYPDASEDGIGRAYLAAGNIHEEIGQFETALERYQKAADYFYSVNGEQNANTISAYAAIASVFGQQGKGEEAARLLREQIEIATDFLGPDHKKTWTMRMNLGAVLADYGDFAGALEVQEDVYQTNLRVIGEDGLESILTRGNIATLLVESDRTGEAEQIYRDNIDRLLAHHPEEHKDAGGAVRPTARTSRCARGAHRGSRNGRAARCRRSRFSRSGRRPTSRSLRGNRHAGRERRRQRAPPQLARALD
jgi:tetratricopeptide (TPR) repeat protein